MVKSPRRVHMLKWHRRGGVCVAVFLFVLVFTGMLLNHGHDFGLDQKPVRSQWVLDWYGLQRPPIPAGYRVGEHWFLQLGDQVYLDKAPVSDCKALLNGAVVLDGLYVVLCGQALLLLSPDGELIERIDQDDGLPPDVRKVGLAAARLVLQQEGGSQYLANLDRLTWTPFAGSVQWSSAMSLPEGQKVDLPDQYVWHDITYERLLLDVHSGRFAGIVGVFIVDLCGLVFLFLALTGVWVWVRRHWS